MNKISFAQSSFPRRFYIYSDELSTLKKILFTNYTRTNFYKPDKNIILTIYLLFLHVDLIPFKMVDPYGCQCRKLHWNQ